MLINVGSAGQRIYDGGGIFEPSGTFTKLVLGWARITGANEHVCHSGAFTGARCNIFNTANTSATVCFPDGSCFFNLVEAHPRELIPPIQGGDSGAPVFIVLDNQRVIAKGTVSARSTIDPALMHYQDFGTTFDTFRVRPW
jgi:streptogrisin D